MWRIWNIVKGIKIELFVQITAFITENVEKSEALWIVLMHFEEEEFVTNNCFNVIYNKLSGYANEIGLSQLNTK